MIYAQMALATSNPTWSDPLYSADLGQAVGVKAALAVYDFFLEEAFSPSRQRYDILSCFDYCPYICFYLSMIYFSGSHLSFLRTLVYVSRVSHVAF